MWASRLAFPQSTSCGVRKAALQPQVILDRLWTGPIAIDLTLIRVMCVIRLETPPWKGGAFQWVQVPPGPSAHYEAGARPQDLPVSAAWDRDHAAEPGMGDGHHLHRDGARLRVPGVSGCENPRKDGEELDRGAKHRRCSSWVRVI